MNNIVGMLIGAALDRRDGEGGLKGALGGYVAEAVVKAAVPIAVTFAIGWGVQFAARRVMHALTSDPELRRKTAARG